MPSSAYIQPGLQKENRIASLCKVFRSLSLVFIKGKNSLMHTIDLTVYNMSLLSLDQFLVKTCLYAIILVTAHRHCIYSNDTFMSINPIAFRRAKTLCSFGSTECSRVRFRVVVVLPFSLTETTLCDFLSTSLDYGKEFAPRGKGSVF